MAGDRDDVIDALVDDFNAWCKQVEDYLTDRQCTHAEYAQSFGYGDDKPRFDRCDADTVALVDKLKARFKGDKRGFYSALGDCCDLLHTGIYCHDREVYSVIIGEVEEQIPDSDGELWPRLQALTDAEFSAVRRRVDAYLPDRDSHAQGYAYFDNSYSRWVMVLDVGKLTELLTGEV